MIKISDIERLDDVSKKEIEHIIDLHEDLKMIVSKEINWFKCNPADAETYEFLIEKARQDNFPNCCKKIAVIRQLKKENCKEK